MKRSKRKKGGEEEDFDEDEEDEDDEAHFESLSHNGSYRRSADRRTTRLKVSTLESSLI